MSVHRGRRVLITGGSSGIGKAIARAFAREGAHVVIAARRPELPADACDEIREDARAGTIVDSVRLDVADPVAVERETARAIARLEGIDVLVNNAGIACAARFEDVPDDRFAQVMAVNLFGTVHMTRAVLPHLKAQRSGHVVNVSSVAGVLGIFGYTAYSASKFAVVGFSEALRQELLPFGVAVSVVLPADVDTPQLAAENRTKPAETRAIAGNVRTIPPDVVARALLRGMDRRRFRIVPGAGARLTERASRHLPGLVRRVIDRPLRRPDGD